MSLLTRIRTQATSIVWGFATTLLLLPVGQHAVGAVLCIETDGHMSVEDAVGLSCGPYAATHEHSPSATSESAAHCGDCIDIPLPMSVDEDCASYRVTPTLSVEVLLPVMIARVPEVREDVRFAASPAPPDLFSATRSTSLLALRTVVLLT